MPAEQDTRFGGREDGARGDELEAGRRVHLTVTGLDVNGDGVARADDGRVVFVEGALPGDRVEAEVTRRAASYARARAQAIVQPSSLRVSPPCPVVGRCGGCPLMPLDYAAQLEWKRRHTVEALARLGGFAEAESLVRPVAGMDHPFHYRNKAQYPVARGPAGEVVLGFYRRGTHEVVPVDPCAVQHPINNALARAARAAIERLGLVPYDERAHSGTVRHVVARVAEASRQALLVIVTREPEVAGLVRLAEAVRQEVPEMVGLAHNVNPAPGNVILGPVTRVVWGQGWIEERVGHLRLRLSPTAFFQVNTRQAGRLYEEVRRIIRDAARRRGPWDRLVDVYCGVGGIGLYAAGEAAEVVGIEQSQEAVEDARANARINGIGHARFVAAPAAQALPALAREAARDGRRQVVVVDPPRRGLEAAALRSLVAMSPSLFVYVSCNPATLARDLRVWVRRAAARGVRYRLGPVQPVDMFPHTAHVEVVAYLERL